jgi:TRAP transporter TAXI family solute receptor
MCGRGIKFPKLTWGILPEDYSKGAYIVYCKKGLPAKILVVFLALIFCFSALCGCTPAANDPVDGEGNEESAGGEATGDGDLKKFEIGGGSLGGAFYILAGTFASYIESELGIPSVASVTEGVAENLRLIDNGGIEAGIGGSNGLYLAWYGTDIYEKEYKDSRLLMGIYPLPQIWLARKDSGITSIMDLKGKRVGVGVGPATWDPVSKPLFEAHGFDYEKDITRVYGGFEDLHTQLGDGMLDALVTTTSGDKNLLPATTELMANHELIALEYDPAAIDRLIEEVPYYTRFELAPGIAPGWEDKPYPDVSQSTVYLFTGKDLPEEDAYRVVKSIYENLDEAAKEVFYLEYTAENPDFLCEQFMVPYHEGAIKFWKEQGLWKE